MPITHAISFPKSPSSSYGYTHTNYSTIDIIIVISTTIVKLFYCKFPIGAGIYDENTATSLPNNGIIALSEHEGLHISCWFSAGDYHTAQFIGLDGMSVSDGANPFDVTTSTNNYSTVIKTKGALSEVDQGVYTCRANGEAGLTELNIGVFTSEFHCK